jgi:hypothetical protein
MTATKILEIHPLMTSLADVEKMLRDALSYTERTQENLSNLHAILCSMTQDWKPARDQSWSAQGMGRVAMIAAGDSATTDRILEGKALIWPEELLEYPLDDNWMRLVRYQAKEHGRIAKLSDAATEPCPDCGKQAFMVVHHHEYSLIPDDGVSRGPICIRRLLACLECFQLTPRTDFRCDNCIA